MNAIGYRKGFMPDTADVKALYEDAGWSAYAQQMPRLMKALRASLFIATAWEGSRLVGLARAVGDGVTIVYIQDILVLKSDRRRGIGSNLVRILLKEFQQVRQVVLLTDDTLETRAFYEALGFASCDTGELVAFVRFM